MAPTNLRCASAWSPPVFAGPPSPFAAGHRFRSPAPLSQPGKAFAARHRFRRRRRFGGPASPGSARVGPRADLGRRPAAYRQAPTAYRQAPTACRRAPHPAYRRVSAQPSTPASNRTPTMSTMTKTSGDVATADPRPLSAITRLLTGYLALAIRAVRAAGPRGDRNCRRIPQYFSGICRQSRSPRPTARSPTPTAAPGAALPVDRRSGRPHRGLRLRMIAVSGRISAVRLHIWVRDRDLSGRAGRAARPREAARGAGGEAAPPGGASGGAPGGRRALPAGGAPGDAPRVALSDRRG